VRNSACSVSVSFRRQLDSRSLERNASFFMVLLLIKNRGSDKVAQKMKRNRLFKTGWAC
jgi:hypothetical protein